MSDTKILIVDDSEYTRSMLASMLNILGFTNIIEAANGYECLDIIKHEMPVIVILDIVMPGINGIDTLRKLRSDKTFSATKVIVFTAASDVKTITAARANDARADAIMVKPTSIETLSSKISLVLQDM